MRLSLVVLVFVFGCRGDATSATKLTRLEIDGGRVTALVPTGFSRGEGDAVLGKDLVGRASATVLTNPARTIRIEIRTEPAEKPADAFDAPLEALLTMLKDGAHATDPSAKWIRDEVVTINDRRYLVLDYRPTTTGTVARELVALTRLKDSTLLLVAFGCDSASEDEWIPVGWKVINSIVAKG